MIDVQRLTKRFGDFVAVDELSFQVQPGEVLGFLGPNGAGKSTTMKMLSGFLTPTAGHIQLMGHDVAKAPVAAKRLLGYLPEGAPSYGEMSVLSFLTFVGQMRGLSGRALQQRLKHVCEQVELLEVLGNAINTLSKGYKRRVGLAQTLLHDPAIMILDEPTDGLDPNQKQQVRELIANLAKDKIVIISTHILEEVTAVCTRAMVIARGKKVADGTPLELEALSRYHQAITLHCAVARDMQALLAQLPGVAAVELSNDEQRITLFPQPGAQLYSEVQRLVQDQQWPVEALYVERGRLDDVFHTLTRTQGGRS